MHTFSTAVALTVLAAAAVTVTAQTPEQPSSQNRSLENAPPSSPQHQESGDFGPSGEISPTSSSVPCQPKREGLKDSTAATAFAAAAVQDGMTEVALAGVALQKSRNNQVREFAKQVVLDYAQSNGALSSIVKCQGLILPTQVDAEHSALVRTLYATSASGFDKAYLKHIYKKHSEFVALFEAASRSGDPEMAVFAQKGLSMLQEHQLLAANLRVGGGVDVVSR